MKSMTDHIREEVRVAMVRQRATQTDLAKQTGLSRQTISNLVNGYRGELSDSWATLLDALGLELTIRPKVDPRSAQRNR